MRLSWVAVVLIGSLAGCSHMRHVDRALLVASTAGLACDWAQTRGEAMGGWSVSYETNPLLGAKPDPGLVDAYFLTAILTNLVVWTVIPRGWRSAIPATVTLAQIDSVASNLPTTGWCGI